MSFTPWTDSALTPAQRAALADAGDRIEAALAAGPLPPLSLPEGAWLICRDTEHAETLRHRFVEGTRIDVDPRHPEGRVSLAYIPPAAVEQMDITIGFYDPKASR